MTTYVSMIYCCPNCAAELGRTVLGSMISEGRDGSLHPAVEDRLQQLLSLYPMRYTDTFFVEPTQESSLGLFSCSVCEHFFLPDSCWVRNDSDFYDGEPAYAQSEDGNFPSQREGDLCCRGITWGKYVDAVDNRRWTDTFTEKRIRLGAVWEMNHHRRESRSLRDSWKGWPHYDQLSKTDFELIGSLLVRPHAMMARGMSELIAGWPREERDELWISINKSLPRLANVADDFIGTLRYADLMLRQATRDVSANPDEKRASSWLSNEQRSLGAAYGYFKSRPESSVDGVHTDLSDKEKQNIDALLSILGSSNFDVLLCAELFRMLGLFDQCLEELRKVSNSEFIDLPTFNRIEYLAADGDPKVGLIPFDDEHTGRRPIEEGLELHESLNELRDAMGLERGVKSKALEKHFQGRAFSKIID